MGETLCDRQRWEVEGEAAPADTSEVIIRSVRGSGNCRLISALATPPARLSSDATSSG